MPRVTNNNSKTGSRSAPGRLSAATLRTAPRSAAPKAAPPKRAAAKTTAAANAALANKEELRARVEKLERANATLRVKNKELRLAFVEAAEKVDALTVRLASTERKAERQARQEASVEAVSKRDSARPARGKRKSATPAPEAESPQESAGSDGTFDEDGEA